MLVIPMNSPQYVLYILIGFVLVVLGAVLPFLIIMQVLESTFFVNFLAYIASVGGLFLGFIGATMYVRERRNKN
jgi:hypothetical protein